MERWVDIGRGLLRSALVAFVGAVCGCTSEAVKTERERPTRPPVIFRGRLRAGARGAMRGFDSGAPGVVVHVGFPRIDGAEIAARARFVPLPTPVAGADAFARRAPRVVERAAFIPLPLVDVSVAARAGSRGPTVVTPGAFEKGAGRVVERATFALLPLVESGDP